MDLLAEGLPTIDRRIHDHTENKEHNKAFYMIKNPFREINYYCKGRVRGKYHPFWFHRARYSWRGGLFSPDRRENKASKNTVSPLGVWKV
jgi:hypothetical protein